MYANVCLVEPNHDLWLFGRALTFTIKLLQPTKNELGGSLDPDEKDVFGVNVKALSFVLFLLSFFAHCAIIAVFLYIIASATDLFACAEKTNGISGIQ